MITRNFDITVRTREQNYIPTVFQVVQNDKNVYSLTIHVVDDAGEIGYSQVDSATITFSKKDGTVVQGNLTIGTNALTYEMGTNEIAYPGEVLASIQLLGPALERLTSARFKFYVVPDLITPGTVQSVSEFAILQELVADVNQLKQDIVNLQVPNDSLTEAKMANDMKKAITGGVAAHDDLVDLQDDLDAHKADNSAHNGFAGNAISISGLSDFNTFNITGLYHGVLSNAIANEPIEATTQPRRVTLINISGIDMQILIYLDGYNAGNMYIRSGTTAWKHFASV